MDKGGGCSNNKFCDIRLKLFQIVVRKSYLNKQTRFVGVGLGGRGRVGLGGRGVVWFG